MKKRLGFCNAKTIFSDFIPAEKYSFNTFAAFQSESEFGNSPLLAHNYNLPVFQWSDLEKAGKKHGHPRNLNTPSHVTAGVT